MYLILFTGDSDFLLLFPGNSGLIVCLLFLFDALPTNGIVKKKKIIQNKRLQNQIWNLQYLGNEQKKRKRKKWNLT